MQLSKTVDDFILKQDNWKEELKHLQKLLLETELVETVKWGMPVYTINGKNVVGIGSFKSYVGMWFFQGSFLSDPKKVLINAQDVKTKGMRQMRFSSMDQMDDDIIRIYVTEAIQNQKDGKEIKPERKKELVVPAELHEMLLQDQNLKDSFDSLTPGKQREFAEYIESAKRIETKLSRLEKIIPLINNGVGLNDKYKK